MTSTGIRIVAVALPTSLGEVDTLVLKSFQPLDRAAQLRREGKLVGDWSRVGGPMVVPYYQRMVEEMAAHGIDCQGNLKRPEFVGDS